jgi:hypothetical protein
MSPTSAATGQTVLEEALPRERPTSPGDGEGPSWVLVRVGSEPHTWGGPQIWWVERQNPKSMFFILDDKEARDWGTIQSGVGLVLRSLTTALDLLGDIVTLIGPV